VVLSIHWNRFARTHRFLILHTLVATTLFASLASSSLQAETWASKLFSTTNHDFGSVSRNAKCDFSFIIENIYEEDVHIAAIRSSCGCTKPILEKRLIKTWEKAELVAQFNTRSFIGNKSAVITVVIDQPFYAEVQLTVQGHIRSDIVVEPGEVNFGEVALGTKREIPVKISYAGRPDWEIVDVRGDSEFLSVRLDPVIRRGNQSSYTMHVSVLNTAPAGDLLDELIVITNDVRDKEFTLVTSAKIAAPVTVTPSQIALGEVVDGQTKSDRFIVKGNRPFRITEIQCLDKRFEFKLPKDAKPVHVIPFAFHGEGVAGTESVKQSLLIKTDMGESIVAECIVTGQVVR
jgi:Protein of unknown function (DUF1573)